VGTIMAAGCLLPLGALAAEVTLVHGDFHVCNVITSRATGEIVAVLDWELATLGDPLADIGSLLAYWVQQDDRIGSTFTATALPGFPTREELAKTHLEESGRDPEALQSWARAGPLEGRNHRRGHSASRSGRTAEPGSCGKSECRADRLVGRQRCGSRRRSRDLI